MVATPDLGSGAVRRGVRVPSSALCENSSAGRAQPCQGWGRGFESRFRSTSHPGGGIGRHAGLKILCPFGRTGSSPVCSVQKALLIFD